MGMLDRINEVVRDGQDYISNMATHLPSASTVQGIALNTLSCIARNVGGTFVDIVAVCLRPSENILISDLRRKIEANFDRINVEPHFGHLVSPDADIRFAAARGNHLPTTIQKLQDSFFVTFHVNGFNFYGKVFFDANGNQRYPSTSIEPSPIEPF